MLLLNASVRRVYPEKFLPKSRSALATKNDIANLALVTVDLDLQRLTLDS